MNKKNPKQKQTHRHREQSGACMSGGHWEDGQNREGHKRYKLPITKQVRHGGAMYSIGNIINNMQQLCMVTDGN